MEKTQDIIIEIRNLTKMYGKTVGVRNLDLQISRGEVFGFLGPNGSGKTTTINLLLDLVKPTSGDIRIFGKDTGKTGPRVRERIGFLPSNPGFYRQMTGIEYLRFFSGIRHCPCEERIHQLAEMFFQVDLSRKISTYSEGMKQIVGIIQAFASSPDLYILDEPTNNLDPLMKQRFYQLVEEEAKKGKTIFLSSHILAEVERLCNRVGIIRNGRLITVSTIESLRERMKKTLEVSFTSPVDMESLQNIENVSRVTENQGHWFLDITGDIRPVLGRLSTLPLETFDLHKMTLEEIFMEFFKSEESAAEFNQSNER